MDKVVVQLPEMSLPDFPYAHAVRCGPWVFCSGQSAVDFSAGLDPAAQVPDGARFLTHPVKHQMKVVYRNLGRILAAGGSSIESVPRVVAFFTRREDVRAYNEERGLHQRMMPTSAALPVSRLLASEALIEIDAIGVVETSGHRLAPFDLPGIPVHPEAGYSKGMRFGDWVFTVGGTASDHVPRDALGGSTIAPEARVDPSYWLGSAVKRQVTYVMREKLLPLLEAAGCSLEDVVRAQVYLTSLERDYAPFAEVWDGLFPGHMPSTVVMPVNGLGVVHCVVEISLIAVRPESVPVSTVGRPTASPAWLGRSPEAVRAGDLLWCSTAAPIDDQGLAPRARDAAGLPHFEVPGTRQMEVIMEELSQTLAAGGSDLTRLAKLTVFTSDLGQMPGYMHVWRSRLAESPCAMTVVEVQGPFFAPGCTVAVDAVAVSD